MRIFIRILIVIVTIGVVVFKKQFMKRMGITDEKTYWLRMLAYSLAGMLILVVRPPIFHLIGITDKTPWWVVTLVYIPLISTTYMIGFIVFGTLLGQKDFVLGKAKKRLDFFTGRSRRSK